MNMFILKILIPTYFISVSNVLGEVFSAISAMKNLEITQGKMLELFEAYLKTQDEKLKQMEKRNAAIKSEYETAVQNPEKYVSNPVNSFRIIKQLHVDWNGTIELMKQSVTEFNRRLKQLKTHNFFPEDVDLEGAVDAILRLQHKYLLDTRDMAEGVLNGVKCGSPLNSNDCFILGAKMMKQKSYHAAHPWLKKALEKFNPEEYVADNKSVVMELIAYNEYNLGNVQSALRNMKDLYLKDPDFCRLSEHIENFQNIVNNETLLKEITVPVDPHTKLDLETYEKLCRGALGLSPSVMKDLKCRYVSTRYPFTKIAPFKVEEYYLQPYIVAFHDILTDEEIEYLKMEVGYNIQRAKVIQNKKNVPSKFRISMNAWLPDDYSPIVTAINNRIKDMIGLELDYSENIQIANYGIGGHYSCHYDFTMRASFSADPRGNRLATVLIYMTDVEQGGNTVFPRLGVSVKPKKGTAVFWFNLKPSGEGNTGTYHGACPVIVGNKWVLNKWIRIVGNEMARPCDLEYQDEGPCRNYTALVDTRLP